MSDPELGEGERQTQVAALMQARRAVGVARKAGNAEAEAAARADVDRAKIALGERGPVWWSDGAPDLNRHMARTTIYAAWYAALIAATANSAPTAGGRARGR